MSIQQPTPPPAQPVSALSALLRNHSGMTPSATPTGGNTPLASPTVAHAVVADAGEGRERREGSQGSQVAARPINGSIPTATSPTFPSQLSPYAQPFLPSGSYMGMNIGTSFAPMSFIGASYTGRTGAGIGMSVSPQYGTHMNYIGPSSVSSSGAMGINGMAPAPPRHQPHLGHQPPQPMNSFGNMGSYLGRGSLNMTGFSLSNSGFGLPYGASLSGQGAGQQFPHTSAQPGISVGAFVTPGMGGSGGERSRELEAKFVKDFTCCGLRLNGLHDLLEHYEEHHVHLAGDLRQQTQSMMMADPSGIGNPALGPVSGLSRGTPNPTQGPNPGSFPNAATSYTVPVPNGPPGIAAALAAGTGRNVPALTKGSSATTTDSGDAPGTPGMMDIDMQMDEDEPPSSSLPTAHGSEMGMGMTMGGGFGGGLGITTGGGGIGLTTQQGQDAYYKGPPLQFVQPSMLSYTIPPPSTSTATPANHMAFNGAGQGAIGRVPRPGPSHTNHHPAYPVPMSATTSSSGHHLTDAQKAERAARKAARKEAKRIARENGEAESSDDGRDAEGFKKYRCPVEGCNKSYKQANGLKYHLNRSINSSHGHLAGMPIVPHNPNA